MLFKEQIPLQCPVSLTVLKDAADDLQRFFIIINASRWSGNPKRLTRLQKRIEQRLSTIDHRPTQGRRKGPLERLLLAAALGDCLSILGRWNGNKSQLKAGVDRMCDFLGAVRRRDLGDHGETELRAHAYYGNALTRLAYAERGRKTEVIAKAYDQLSACRKRFDGSFPMLNAAIHRDLGDLYIAKLEWAYKDYDIDGSAIAALRIASGLFAGELTEKNNRRLYNEYMAAQSSLAVALAMTARNLRKRRGKVKKGLFLHGATKTEKANELLQEAELIAWRVWHAYERACRSSDKPSHRWARSISNIAHAALFCFQLEKEWTGCAALAEAAFRSVTRLGLEEDYKEPVFQMPSLDASYRRSLRRGVSYTLEDHEDRYCVNYEGLEELYKEAKSA